MTATVDGACIQTVPSTVQIEFCGPDHVPALQAFIDEHWRRGHVLARDRALLEWQYAPRGLADVPAGGVSVLLARRMDRIIGMMGLIPADMNVRGQTVRGAWIAMLYVVPDARHTMAGVSLLNEPPRRGIEAAGVLGINSEVARLYQAMGYTVLDDLPRWVGVFDVESTVSLLTGADVAAARSFFSEHMISASNIGSGGTDGITVHPLDEPFDSTWDRFWLAHAKSLVGTDRDARFLNWRYVEHPRFKYDRLVARRADGTIAGLAVFRIEPVTGHSAKILRIVEFLACDATAAMLASAIVQAGRRHRVAFADFHCASARFAAPLLKVGFYRQHSGRDAFILPTRCQPLEQGAFQLRGAMKFFAASERGLGKGLPDDLYVTKSDGDMDRPNEYGDAR